MPHIKYLLMVGHICVFLDLISQLGFLKDLFFCMTYLIVLRTALTKYTGIFDYLNLLEIYLYTLEALTHNLFENVFRYNVYGFLRIIGLQRSFRKQEFIHHPVSQFNYFTPAF